MPMPLNQLLPQAETSVLIRELTLDSRKVLPGDMFLAIPGAQQDAREHIADAIARGATAVVYEAAGAPFVLANPNVALIPLKGLAAQLSSIAGRFYGEPSRAMNLVGVTGTNGKTSVTQLLAQALDLLDERCGIVGTLGCGFHGDLQAGRHTTPDALAVQAMLAQLKQAGARAVAMEVSSHGLDQGRVTALDFDVAVFTNLTRDHLDYHGSMDSYAAVKARLFAWPELKYRVINLDDAFGRELAKQRLPSRLIGYSLDNPTADLYCLDAQFSDNGIQARIVTPQGDGLLRSSLIGVFNLSNLLATIGALIALGFPQDEILQVIPRLQGPAGRMQRLGGGKQPLVVVDYAHTPDALENVLNTIENIRTKNEQLITIVGCGGDRDKTKRPLMAKIASSLSDKVIFTSDNPRTENPEIIIEEMEKGVEPQNFKKTMSISDRKQAIKTACQLANENDIILIAGKGHETYQEINGVRHDFDDMFIVKEMLNQLNK
jgi:UDP-N-acetylmuramoyl-L-alanyl-D-glutamate--2,6-diaminopimelate ligase